MTDSSVHAGLGSVCGHGRILFGRPQSSYQAALGGISMGLHSQLFRGDAKLEAAAVYPTRHITTGSVGPHVAKIQRALNILAGANLKEDGIYGPATASAVLSYKRKRDIINRSYQTQADNIVGVMTMAALDQEMMN